MKWELKFLPEAIEDLNHLDTSIRPQILKGIKKVLQNPEAKSLGGYGEPLGNKNVAKLAGLYKIKFRGIGQRVVYALHKTESSMIVIIISAREEFKVYTEAEKRRYKNNL